MPPAPFTNHLPTLHQNTTRTYLVHRSMLALFLCGLFLIIGVMHTAATSRTPTTPDFATIDAYVEAQIHEQRIPGLALGIVHGNEIVHLKGFGIADPTG